MEITSNYASYTGREVCASLKGIDEEDKCRFEITLTTKEPECEPKVTVKEYDNFETALLDYSSICAHSRLELERLDGISEDSSAVTIPRTMQEIADFFGCYVAKDFDDTVCAYKTEPYLDTKEDEIYYDPFRWCTTDEENTFFTIPDSFVILDNIDWRQSLCKPREH